MTNHGAIKPYELQRITSVRLEGIKTREANSINVLPNKMPYNISKFYYAKCSNQT
jgi:hypothetical protein